MKNSGQYGEYGGYDFLLIKVGSLQNNHNDHDNHDDHNHDDHVHDDHNDDDDQVEGTMPAKLAACLPSASYQVSEPYIGGYGRWP